MPESMEEWAKLLVETWQSMDFGRLEPYFAEDAVYAAGGAWTSTARYCQPRLHYYYEK